MKLEDLYLINKEEWLDVIKDKCKKKAKSHFWGWSACLILFLLMLTIVIYSPTDKAGFVYFVYLLTLFLLALMSGWLVLKTHSFFKTIDGLGTPEQLLNKFKKYVKDKSIIWTIGNLVFGGWFACFVFTSDFDIILKVISWILILAAAIYSISRLIRGKYFVASSDEEITRRLQELIGEE